MSFVCGNGRFLFANAAGIVKIPRMKLFSFLPLFLLLFPASAFAASGLIPIPVSAESLPAAPVTSEPDGENDIRAYDSEAASRAVLYFNAIGKCDGGKSPFAGIRIVFAPLENAEIVCGNPEGYVLEIGDGEIKISAQTYAGYFYGIQTLRQMLPPQSGADEKISLPACRIVDYPRFSWRGFMLDSVRHYQSPEWIKKLIDLLASQKINTLHWHLTDDQGWRIEIKKYPQLTQRGAWREHIGFGLKPEQSVYYDADGNYGGFYTQEQIREIIDYAASRNITIVPEIELPGHALGALSVFPQLGCTGGPYKVGLKGGVFDDVFCAGNEAVYSFFEDVFNEVIALFPGKFVHVGGDECPKTRWKKCPKCQEKIRSENLKNEHELQSYVIRRVERFLAGKGKRLIGWDEILEGGLAPDATVMSWRGADGGIAAAKLNHDVVMAPNSHCYFDYSQARTGEPSGIGGFIPLERVYSFNPTKGVPAEFSRHILGGQANLWTEYIPDEKHAEYMIAPRISALAEVLWSPRERCSWDEFQDRMMKQYKRYEAAGINYRKPEGVLIRAVSEGVSFSPDLKNAPVAYTLDGSEPGKDSSRATAAENYIVKIPESDGRIRVRARAILPDGSLGRVNERAVNLPKAKVSSSLGSVYTNFPERAADGSTASVYWADRPPRRGDAVTAIFEKTQRVRTLRCLTGKNENGGGGDRLLNGVLEISEDGKNWREIAKFADGIAEAKNPAGISFKGVRLRVTGGQSEWLVVREFELIP